MAKTKRSAEKEALWRGILQEFAVSSETARAFCRRMKISEQSFYNWRRELARRDVASGASDGLLPVKIVDTMDASFVPGVVGSNFVEITRGGWTVRVDEGVDSQRLRDVLVAIESVQRGTEPS